MSTSSAVSFLAPAKLNISLRVYGKRPDGLHDIRSVMVPVSLWDEVTVEEAPGGISVSSNDPEVPAGRRNTCHRAAELYRERTGAPEGVRIRIRKAIPREAGLGGGSSDAAASLKGMAALTGNRISPGEFLSLAADVGADVPFFLAGGPALVEGFGDLLTPIEWEVPFFAVIVMPAFGLSTREGYERLGRARAGPPERGNPPVFREWGEVSSAVENDFEEAWESVRPDIPRTKKELMEAGAEAAGLSGSGSAVFGLFRDEGSARKAMGVLAKGTGRKLFVVRNL